MGVDEQDRLAGFRTVLGDYFGVMGIEFVRGRTFEADDLAGDSPAVVVDQAFERAFFPGEPWAGRSRSWIRSSPSWAW